MVAESESSIFALAKLGDAQSARAVVRDLPIQEGSIRREIIDVLRHLAGTSILGPRTHRALAVLLEEQRVEDQKGRG